MSVETQALTERPSVEALVLIYEAAEADIKRSFAVIAAATDRLTAAFSDKEWSGVSLKSRHRGHCDIDFKQPEDTIKELRREMWECLIERSEVRKAMSIKAWEDLEKKVQREDPPPITVANVSGMLEQFRAEIPQMLKDAVDEVFDFLRPRRSEYKTNTEFEIGERVIVSGAIGRGYGRESWRVVDWWEQRLIALENVFNMIDGKVRQKSDGYYASLSTAIKDCPDAKCHGATPLFEFRGHRNGNLHLKFRRMDLVRRLNAIAGGARLRPADLTAAE